jgi:hypothetical protein
VVSPASVEQQTDSLALTGRDAGSGVAPDLVFRLRAAVNRRPRVDRGLAAGLREWLEDGVGPAVSDWPANRPPLRVDRRALANALSPGAENDPPGAAVLTTSRLRGALVNVLFRQIVTSGTVDDPIEDGLAALAAAGREGLVHAFAALEAPEKQALASELGAQVGQIRADWRPIPSGWLPRTTEWMSIPLAGGRVLLTDLADLVVGTPSSGVASVCLVAVRSGERRDQDRPDAHFRALLETVRSGAAPFAVATYYPRHGDLDLDPVDDEILTAAVRRTLDGLAELCPPTARRRR